MRGSERGQAALLLAVGGLYLLATVLAGTFLNVYLWKKPAELRHDRLVHRGPADCRGSQFFWLGGKWVKEHNKMNALRLGIAVSGFFYLLVLWLQGETVHFIWPLGGGPRTIHRAVLAGVQYCILRDYGREQPRFL
ncbi:hypothetical protein ACFSQ7_38395 [Paenibacillus rhizoplanae]